jgi:hypothetical protein
LGEYRHNTDPNKADDLHALFGKHGVSMSMWCWVVIALLLAGMVAAWVLGKRTSKLGKPGKKGRAK